MLRQQAVEFVDPEPLRCALGEPLEAAFGPKSPSLGFQPAKISISQASSPAATSFQTGAADRRGAAVHRILMGELAPPFDASGIERSFRHGGSDGAAGLVAVRGVSVAPGTRGPA